MDNLNPNKHEKNRVSYFSPIICVRINIHRVKAKSRNFQVLFNNGFSNIIMMGNIISNSNRKTCPMEWQNQAETFMTNQKVKIKLCLP